GLGGLDQCGEKAWRPPDTTLDPVLEALLDQWSASYRPPFEGIRVVGARWSRRCYDAREFLARHQIPYQWLDVETTEGKALLDKAAKDATLPVVLLPDGAVLANPNPAELAARVGLHTTSQNRFFDLVIVGGGPAGLAAAVYGASEGLKTVIVEREAPGRLSVKLANAPWPNRPSL